MTLGLRAYGALWNWNCGAQADTRTWLGSIGMVVSEYEYAKWAWYWHGIRMPDENCPRSQATHTINISSNHAQRWFWGVPKGSAPGKPDGRMLVNLLTCDGNDMREWTIWEVLMSIVPSRFLQLAYIERNFLTSWLSIIWYISNISTFWVQFIEHSNTLFIHRKDNSAAEDQSRESRYRSAPKFENPFFSHQLCCTMCTVPI